MWSLVDPLDPYQAKSKKIKSHLEVYFLNFRTDFYVIIYVKDLHLMSSTFLADISNNINEVLFYCLCMFQMVFDPLVINLLQSHKQWCYIFSQP